MPKRSKVLIIEHDDFLRELLGNLLHKKGYYIMNGDSVHENLKQAEGQRVDHIIIGTSCSDFKGKSTIHHLQKMFPQVKIFLLNQGNKEVSYLSKNQQIQISELSVDKIIEAIVE